MKLSTVSYFAILGAAILAPRVAFAIPFVDRTIVPDPFDAKINDEGGFIYGSSSWGEIAKYASTSDGAHNWDVKLGASIEMYRFANLWAVDLGSEIELLASPNNDIQFQPIVFYWQESLFVMRRDGFLDWGLGYYHRCRHDVDNIAEEYSLGEDIERVCIWDSVTLRAYPAPFVWRWDAATSGSVRFTLDEHYYGIREDDVPEQYADRSLSLDNLVDTIALGLVSEPLRWTSLGWYVDLKEYTDFYAPGSAATGFGRTSWLKPALPSEARVHPLPFSFASSISRRPSWIPGARTGIT